MTFFGWEGDRRHDGTGKQPTAGDELKSHLLADCLYTGISSGPNEYERTLPFEMHVLSCIVIAWLYRCSNG